MEARQLCRNSTTTSTTSSSASTSVSTTALIECAHEIRRVVDDAVFQAFGKIARHVGHRGLHVGGQLQCIRTRRLEDGDGHRRHLVEIADDAVVRRAELDAGHILQARDLALLAGLDDDLAELFFGRQAAVGIDQQLLVDALRHRLGAHHASGHLHVLLAHGRHHIAGRHVARRDLLRIEPQAHGVAAAAEDLDLAHARDARQRVAHLQFGVVAQVFQVVAVAAATPAARTA